MASAPDDPTRLGVPPEHPSDAAADGETRLAPTSRPPTHSSAPAKSVSSSSGWLSSSDSIDHGRFDPGTLLGGRYRIVGKLGRGGMGEVYRADDLKLGQPVGLKFLPPDVDRDPARLTQLHTEVRMARQVSHPNVCRVYDIDEVDGHTFLSMEYVFLAYMLSWLLRRHVSPLGADIDRMFATMGNALFQAALLWLAYLGLEPYVRRYSPDSLIGWTRLLAGRWRDARVGRDVMIGVSAGLAMTVFYAIHNVLPPLFGLPEPRPIVMEWNLLLGQREILGYLLSRVANAIQGAMLCVVGVVALLIWLKRRWLAALAAIVCFTPVAINGMFPPGTPVLDIVLGTALMIVFILTIVRFGLLATMAALITHFILLRAPLTTDLGTWRGPLGLWFLGSVAVMGLGACYLARSGSAGVPVQTYAEAQAI